MNEITVQTKQLPDNLPDLAAFVLVGREKLTAVRAEIRAIDKLQLAEDVRQQKRDEAFMLSEALLDAEKRIGELTKKIPKSDGGRPSKTTDSSVASFRAKTKAEVISDLGFTPKQVERFEILADNPDVVEQVKQEARENEDIPTRTRVIDIVQQRKFDANESAKRNSEASKLYRQFHSAIFGILTLYSDSDDADEKLKMLADWIDDCKGISVQDYIKDIGRVIMALEIIRSHFINHERS